MKINLFKTSLFKDLKQYKWKIADSVMKYKYEESGKVIQEWDFCGGQRWFNPFTQHLNPLSKSFPEVDESQYSSNWSIILNIPNYTSLFVINELYNDRKDVLIEDSCCGVSYFTIYLHYLGFSNFSFIENEKEIIPGAIEGVMAKHDIKYVLNSLDVKPIIINHVGYPYYPRKIDENGKIYLEDCNLDEYPIKYAVQNRKWLYNFGYIPEETELICCYQRDNSKANQKNLEGFKFLCTGEDETLGVYCREHLHEEFTKKLEKYKIEA